MATRIRLQRHGRKNYAFYSIVIAHADAPRDGRFIEKVGTYNPNTNPATIDLNFERALYWVQVGAQPTDTVRNILSEEGVYLMKHLLGGVKKAHSTRLPLRQSSPLGRMRRPLRHRRLPTRRLLTRLPPRLLASRPRRRSALPRQLRSQRRRLLPLKQRLQLRRLLKQQKLQLRHNSPLHQTNSWKNIRGCALRILFLGGFY